MDVQVNNKDVAEEPLFSSKFFKNDFWYAASFTCIKDVQGIQLYCHRCEFGVANDRANACRGQELSSEQSHKSYRPFTIAVYRLQHRIGWLMPKGSQDPRFAYFNIRHLALLLSTAFSRIQSTLQVHVLEDIFKYICIHQEAGSKATRTPANLTPCVVGFLKAKPCRSGHDNSSDVIPFFFHGTNVLLHGLVTVLVFRLAADALHDNLGSTLMRSSFHLVKFKLWGKGDHLL